MTSSDAFFDGLGAGLRKGLEKDPYLANRFDAHRGYALALHSALSNVGDSLAPVVIGAMLSGWFLVQLSWREAAAINSLPALLILPLILVFVLRERAEPAIEHPEHVVAPFHFALSQVVVRKHQVQMLVSALERDRDDRKTAQHDTQPAPSRARAKQTRWSCLQEPLHVRT